MLLAERDTREGIVVWELALQRDDVLFFYNNNNNISTGLLQLWLWLGRIDTAGRTL